MSSTTLLSIESALGGLSRSAASAPVTLGSMILTGTEVPSLLAVGGSQMLSVHKLVGGNRIIQALGRDPDALDLGGMFTGPNAQSRAKVIEMMRDAGAPVRLGVAGLSRTVVIRSFSYTYQHRGAVLPYRLALEVLPPATVSPAAALSALSNLVGSDAASALSNVTATASQLSSYVADATGTIENVVGQVTPIADIVGLGGTLAAVQDKLTVASGLASAGTSLSAAPAAASALISSLQGAGASIQTVISQAGSNLESLSGAAQPGSLVGSMSALQAAVANAGALSAAADAGALVNRASANAALAAGMTPSLPVVHS